MRKRLMSKLYLWALDPASPPKVALGAAQAIIKAEAQNQADERMVGINDDAIGILDAAKRLGISINTVDAESEPEEASRANPDERLQAAGSEDRRTHIHS